MSKMKYRGIAISLILLIVMSLMGIPVLAVDVTLTLNVTAANIVHGQPLSASTLTGTAKVTADDSPVDGSFAWSNANTIPPIGTGNYPVTFIPETTPDGTTYTGLSASASVTVAAGSYTTASQINSAVGTMLSSATVTDINALAAAVRALNVTEKSRLSRSTISKFGDLYKSKNGFTETVTVYSSGFSSSSKMPNNSYCYGAAMSVADTVEIELEQLETTGSASLQFTASMKDNKIMQSPITLHVALPDNFSTSREYYVRTDGGAVDCSIERSGDQYYAVFTTATMGTFRLIRETSGSKEDDKEYEISSFWEDVIDQIIDAESGDRIRVNVGTRTTMAADVLRELKGQKITLVLCCSNADTISIYGKNIKSISSSKDYYTIKTLAATYDTSTTASSSRSVSSVPAVPQKPVVVPAPAPVPAPQPPAWTAPVASSGASSSQTVSELENELPDIVIEAEEDNPPEEESTSDIDTESKPQESTGGRTVDSFTFGVFVVAVIALAAVVSGVITFAAWSRRRGKYL